MNEARQNKLKLPISNAVIASTQTSKPTPKKTYIPIFLPRLCIVRETGTTLLAVPNIIKAMGAVAQLGEGAKVLPASVPAKCIRGKIEPATALLRLNTHAFL